MPKYNGKPTRLHKPDKESGQEKKKENKISIDLHGGEHISRGFEFFKNSISIAGSVLMKIRESKIIIAGIITGLLLAFIFILIDDFNNVKSIAHFKPNVTTKIYDKNGILISELFMHKREVIPFEKIPGDLINALIAMEDNEFYSHNGINIKGIVRAFFINIFSGRIRQGGSTITQQLSKILLTSRKRNLYRKIKEAFIAIMMEINYSKEEILTLYLNQIFLGHGTYGVESASKLYFNKHAWDLNLAEASLIATLPSSPNRLSPIRHPKRAIHKHKIVLAKMVELGFIDVKKAEKVFSEFWPDYLHRISSISPTLNTWSSRVNRAPWFTEHIRRKLLKKYGKETVYNRGLLVYTTLDLNKQEKGREILSAALQKQSAVSSSLSFKNEDFIIDNYSDIVGMVSDLFDISSFRKKGSREIEKLNDYIRSNLIEELEGLNFITGTDPVGSFIYKYKKSYFNDKELQRVEGCLVSINQKNGYVETMIGGGEFSSINQLNRVFQSRRQPGSAIKPLLYTSAIESGEFTPATTILDSPIVYLDNEGGDWLPENYEGEYYGLVRLRKALQKSINIISIRIADKLGIDHLIKYYSKLLKFDKKETKKRIPRNFSIALGSFEISPFELTRAYAIIANGGRDLIPITIRYIKDREGRVIENREADVKRILSEKKREGTIQIIKPETAQIMINLLKSVVSGGTGRGADPGRPAGGKTGTTNNWKDAWFMGFTPELTTGLWMGYDRMGLSLGIGQTSGAVAAPVWGKYMKEALKNRSHVGFPVYANLVEKEICSRSGLLPSPNCRNVIREVFAEGTAPEQQCEICKESFDYVKIPRRGPRENISWRQKRSIIKKIINDDDDNTIENMGDDLLGTH